MAKRKNKEAMAENAESAVVTVQPITETLEKNYMVYAMSVIISRAIPEIDGFKPSHRKLLYTMYKMGLMNGERTKSANVVGQTMKLNPHGESAIYETLVRLTRDNESLLHPFVDSKGSFGKQYSTSMAYAASRYTSVKLDPICAEIFKGIDKNAVDFVPNYDNTTVEPVLLPTTFPNILVSPNMGIAVGMASRICSFNLSEVCDGAIQVLHNPLTDVDQMLDILKAPDFPGGGYVLYDRQQFAEIYRTGRGSFKLRARYEYDKTENCINILEIPYSTTIEAIQKAITDLIKEGKLKEVTDFRDEIGLQGFRLTIDLRRGTDPELLMAKLFKMTPLECEFSCNFNVLIDGVPKQLGVIDVLKEWIIFRIKCVRRELTHDLNIKKDKLHLLLGLSKILLDIDLAIKIIRETKNEKDVVPNLMKGFSIDEIQAEYIADIKLRNLNREHILNRLREIEELKNEIAELEDVIASDSKIKKIIVKQLQAVKAKYAKPRRTQIIYEDEIIEYKEESMIENYNVKFIFTKEGYFKKITLASLRGNDEQTLKDGDYIVSSEDGENNQELIFFSDRCQCYKAKASDFENVKASMLGDYIPAKLNFDDGEQAIFMKNISEYNESHNFVFIFENGKGVRVPVTAYETKTNRKKLTGAYSASSPIVAIFYESEPFDIMLVSNNRKAIVINSSLIPQMSTRSSSGTKLFNLKKGTVVEAAFKDFEQRFENAKSYKKTKIPASGVTISEYDATKQQISIL